MKKKLLVGSAVLTLIMILVGQTVVLADGDTDWNSRDPWKEANDWYAQGSIDEDLTEYGSAKAIINKFSSMIEVLGTTVIVCVTTFLGIKYMYASAQGKAEVKDSLATLLVACVFFFGWNGIWAILFNGSSLTFNTTDTTYEGFIGGIASILSFLGGILSVAAVIYIGLRYIFAGATGKAELKGKSIQFLIGFILAFCAITVIRYISTVVLEIF